MRIRSLMLVALLASACGASNITAGEAADALSEASYDSQANALASNTIEVSTTFTLGQGVQKAAADVKSFLNSELPCAEVTLQGATLTIQYGANGGMCTYRGQSFTGEHTITVTSADEGNVVVQHTWKDLSNGKVKVNGSATVTWSKTDQTRHVQHQLTFTRLSDGVTATGSGDRTQRALSGGVTVGIQVDGTRTWTGPKGTWKLSIEGVQMRWQDPVPFAGSYTLDTPAGKTITLSFQRLDDTTIQVTLSGGRRDYTFKVHETGDIENNSAS